jgi:hypothetical protein
MSEAGQRAELVRQWWAKAEESLSSAQVLFDVGNYNSAANRLYYAVFYGVTAALLEKGHSLKKHTGVRSEFHREFIRTSLLDQQWSTFYNRLFQDRHEGDYDGSVFFDREHVESQLAEGKLFLAELRPLVDSLA